MKNGQKIYISKITDLFISLRWPPKHWSNSAKRPKNTTGLWANLHLLTLICITNAAWMIQLCMVPSTEWWWSANGMRMESIIKRINYLIFTFQRFFVAAAVIEEENNETFYRHDGMIEFSDKVNVSQVLLNIF